MPLATLKELYKFLDLSGSLVKVKSVWRILNTSQYFYKPYRLLTEAVHWKQHNKLFRSVLQRSGQI